MAELIGKTGTWTFDGGVVRIVPGRDEDVSRLRTALGEVAVPLAALAGIAFEAAPEAGDGKKAKNGAGRIRLRLRDGADPLLQACGNRLADDSDPYQLEVPAERGGVAEYFANEVHDALSAAQIPAGPTDRYLVAAPAVPISADGQDGTGLFDGEVVRLEWGWMADVAKRKAGDREWPLAALEGVDWRPSAGLDWGWIRFRVRGTAVVDRNPRLDPNCLTLWGTKKENGNSAAFAAAVVGRMTHPSAADAAGTAGAASTAPVTVSPASDAAPSAGASGADHDAMLRRLRELGDLHREGVLTDDEFSAAKQAAAS
jgi:hypothetical protein